MQAIVRPCGSGQTCAARGRDDRAAAIGAVIGGGARRLILGSVLAAGLGACAASEEELNREVAFRCQGGEQFVAVFEPDLDSVVISMQRERIRLPQLQAASGARYGDGGTTFWSKGDEALLERPGATWRGCVGQQTWPPED